MGSVLEQLPNGFLVQDRQEAFAPGQAEDVPQAVVQLRAIDPVAVRAPGQTGALDGADLGGVLDPLLIPAGRVQVGGQGLDTGFGAGDGEEQDLVIVQPDGVAAQPEARAAVTAPTARAVHLELEGAHFRKRRLLHILHGGPRHGENGIARTRPGRRRRCRRSDLAHSSSASASENVRIVPVWSTVRTSRSMRSEIVVRVLMLPSALTVSVTSETKDRFRAVPRTTWGGSPSGWTTPSRWPLARRSAMWPMPRARGGRPRWSWG